MSERLIVALDGHDGSGKTTLAYALAERLGGTMVRPFAGETGAQLLHAGERQDIAGCLSRYRRRCPTCAGSRMDDRSVIRARFRGIIQLLAPLDTHDAVLGRLGYHFGTTWCAAGRAR